MIKANGGSTALLAAPGGATVRDSHARQLYLTCARLLVGWIARSRERRALGDLATDARLLRDLDLTRRQALAEAGKPFWRR